MAALSQGTDRFGFSAPTPHGKPSPAPPNGPSSALVSSSEANANADLADGNSTSARAKRNAALLENKRTLKWLRMYEGWDRWSQAKKSKIKSRVRKGIPDAMRGRMWMVICGGDALKASMEGTGDGFDALRTRSAVTFEAMSGLISRAEREELAAQREFQATLERRAAERERERNRDGGTQTGNSSSDPSSSSKVECAEPPQKKPGHDPQKLLSDQQRSIRKWDLVISADLSRTYPDHCMFHRGGFGQELLQSVLRAYGLAHPSFGYTQGMNFIAAMFLSYMPARDAFYVLTQVMDYPPWNLKAIFSDRTPMVPQLWFQFDALLKKYIPRVHAHFGRENVMPSMYVTKWFVTLFTRDFGFDLVVRVWDIFLHQGWKVIHRVSLALLKMHERELLDMDMEKILYFVRELPTRNGGLDAESVLTLAHKIPLRTKEIEDLEVKWKQQNGDG